MQLNQPPATAADIDISMDMDKDTDMDTACAKRATFGNNVIGSNQLTDIRNMTAMVVSETNVQSFEVRCPVRAPPPSG